MNDFDTITESADLMGDVPAMNTEPISVACVTPKRAQAFSLPKLKAFTQEYMSLSRMIGIGLSANLPDLGEEARISLHLASQVEVSEWVDVVRLSGAFGCVTFSDGARLIRALSGIDLGDRSTGDNTHSTWLYASILGRLQGSPLACADQIAREDILPTGDDVVIRVVVRSAIHVFSVHAYASSKAWLAFTTNGVWRKEQLPDYECMSLWVDIPVILGRHRCSAKTLCGLKIGDIILPEMVNFLCSGEGAVNFGALRLRVCYQAPRSLKIIEVEKKLEDSEFHSGNMPDDDLTEPEEHDHFDERYALDEQDASALVNMRSDEVVGATDDNGNGAVFDTLPVVLDLELGRIHLMMGELKSIGAGVVLPFEGGSPTSVAIASSGRVLGRGEIVEINGQMGIRITQWGTVA